MYKCLRALLPVLLAVTLAGCSQNPAEAVARGDAYVAEGRLAEAVVEYRNALQQDPRLGDARLKLAQTYEKLGDRAGAYREYIRAADLLPQDIDTQLKAAAYLLATGQFEDARTRAEKVLALDPKSSRAIVLKASAMANLKDLDGAISEIEEALKAQPDDPSMRGGLAVLEMAKGNTADAEREFRRAVAVDVKNVNSQLALAVFLFQTNRVDEAEQALLKALELEPKNLLTNRALAVLYVSTRRAPMAEPYLKTIAETSTDGTGSLALADYYSALGRFADARRVLDGLLGNEKLFSETRRRIAAILYGEKKTAEALKVIEDVLAKNRNDSEALLLRARIERLDGKSDLALASAQAAVKANPNSAAAHYLIGELHVANRRTDEAIAAFAEVLRLNPRVPGAQLHLARLNLAKGGGASTSVGYSEQVLKQQPGNPLAQLTLVSGLLAQGDVTRAEREMKGLLTRFPKSAAVQTQMGRVMIAKRDQAGARQYYERALSLDGNSLDAIAGLVTLDLAAKRTDAARSRVNAKLSERPEEPRLIELAARTELAANDLAGAERHLQRLIELAPERLSAYGLLAALYTRQQRLDDARAQLSRLASKQPNPVGPQTMIGMLYEQEGRADEARKMYEQVLGYEPRAAVAANNLAWMMAERGDNLDVALKYAQTAKSVLPNQPEVNDTLAWVYYKKDLASLAVEPLEQAIKTAPANPAYHYRLGLVYLKLGETGKARHSLQQALKLNPAFPGSADAKSKLQGL